MSGSVARDIALVESSEVPGYQFKTRAPLLQFAETEHIADEARNRNV